MEANNAVVVGAGPNGLAAAIVLARNGVDVTVYEMGATVGGGARSAELTLPGFVHDHCSAVHPLGAGSPFLRQLPLEDHGLDWVHPEVALAHPFLDGSAAVLDRDPERTASTLGVDHDRYLDLVGPFLGRWRDLAPDVLRPVASARPRHPLLMARFGLTALQPAALVARRLRGPGAKALVAGLSAHAIAPLSTTTTGGVALLFALAAHDVGWPSPLGGSQALADAMAAHLRHLGGEIVTGQRVGDLDELAPARAYLLDVAVPGLLALAGRRLSSLYAARLRRVPPGPGVFKVDFALDGPVPWSAEPARQAGTVHLGASIAEIAAALGAVGAGNVPEHAFVIAAQPTLADPARAPDGKHVLWAYTHVPYGFGGDATEAVEAQIERFAPGFRDRVLAKASLGPAQLEADNPNIVGGDISFGRFGGLHTLSRPVLARMPYRTSDPSIYLCSAAAPPGPGVHGMCGYHAGRDALRRRFGRKDAASAS
ncbi:MAG: phytoene desaturase family protein [Acidimicrobiia bacterium]